MKRSLLLSIILTVLMALASALAIGPAAAVEANLRIVVPGATAYTFTEAGFPSYNMIYWFGMMAPADTPPAIVEQLHQAIAKAVQAPKVREAFASRGAIATSNSPAEFSQRVAEETKVWKEVISRAGVKVE